MDKALLVFYAGSSSIGFSVFTLLKEAPPTIDATAAFVTAVIRDRRMLCIVEF